MEHQDTRSAFSRPHTLISVGPDPTTPRPPPPRPLSCPTLCAWMNTSAPACCADFSQPQQMVLTLQRAHAATPGTQGKSVRVLASLSGSTRTHGKHRRNSMCARANMQTNAVARGSLGLELFRGRPSSSVLSLKLVPKLQRTFPARGFRADLWTFLSAHKESDVTNERLSPDAL